MLKKLILSICLFIFSLCLTSTFHMEYCLSMIFISYLLLNYKVTMRFILHVGELGEIIMFNTLKNMNWAVITSPYYLMHLFVGFLTIVIFGVTKFSILILTVIFFANNFTLEFKEVTPFKYLSPKVPPHIMAMTPSMCSSFNSNGNLFKSNFSFCSKEALLMEKLEKFSKEVGNNPVESSVFSDFFFLKDLYELAYCNLKHRKDIMIDLNTIKKYVPGDAINNVLSKMAGEQYEFKKFSQELGEVECLEDLLVLEVIRMLLSLIFKIDKPYYKALGVKIKPYKITGKELSCKTPLSYFSTFLSGVSLVYKGEIDLTNISHIKLMKVLKVSIKDKDFMSLISKALTAGYFYFNSYEINLSNNYANNIISPVLADIYLEEWEAFMYNFAKKNYKEGGPKYNNLSWKLSEEEITEEDYNMLWEESYNLVSTPALGSEMYYVSFGKEWMMGFVNWSMTESEEVIESLKVCWMKKLLDPVLEIKIEPKVLLTSGETFSFSGFEINSYLVAPDSKKILLRVEQYKKSYGKTDSEIKSNILRVKSKPFFGVSASVAKVSLILKDLEILLKEYSSNLMKLSKDSMLIFYKSLFKEIGDYYICADNVEQMKDLVFSSLYSSCVDTLAFKFSLSPSEVIDLFGEDLNKKRGYTALKSGKKVGKKGGKHESFQKESGESGNICVTILLKSVETLNNSVWKESFKSILPY